MRTGFDKKVRGWAAAALLAVGSVLTAPAAAAAQAVPPDAEWRTVETEHFRVTFPEHLQGMGLEAAARAERAWDALSGALVDPPKGRVELLLTDHVDASNGFARVAPYPQITLYARPPLDGLALSHYDDWLELVIVHELAHVFHLDESGPLGGLLRSLFGRVPVAWPFFPNLGTPRWTIEGLATWYESELTRTGRVHGTFHDMVVRTAVLENRFERIDQASGDSPVWPAGQRPYIYGSLFWDFLLERHGAENMGRFVEAVADQLVPYRPDAAAKEAFGVSFSEAWRQWRGSLEAEVAALRAERMALGPLTEPLAVTHGARVAFHPRVAPDGSTLAYALDDGHDDPRLRASAPDGRDPETLTRTNGTSAFSFAPDGSIVFSQLELTDPYRLRGDLYRLDRDGDVTRLTRGARLDQPSVTPDGERAVAVETGQGTTRLVTVDLATGDVTPLGPFDPDVHWAFPAVSPDGRWIAASRWNPGAYFDVVVLDGQGRVVAEVTRDRAVDVAPAWSGDGAWLVWSSDRSGIANVMAARIDPSTGAVLDERQVTNLLTGALYPSVDPRNRWIHFSAYHSDGWEVERVPFDPGVWLDPFPVHPRLAPGWRAADGRDPAEPPADAPATAADVQDYSPLPSVLPRYWEPAFSPSVRTRDRDVLGAFYGFRTQASDLVGRHALDLDLEFSTTGARPAGFLAYRWAGLGNPLLGLSASQGWDASGPYRVEGQDSLVPRRVYVREREQAVSGDVTFLHSRYRRALSFGVGGGLVWERRGLLDEALEPEEELRLLRPESRLSSLRFTFGASTVRSHDLSVGPAEGWSFGATARRRRELDLPDSLESVAGSDRSYDEVVGRLRLFGDFPGPGWADHVLALRVSAGAARGPAADAFHFDAGGNPGETEPVTGFGVVPGRFYYFPARGYQGSERSGRYAWSASGEYRFPLALVNRGLGLFPVHLDRLSGTLFVDAANAWGAADDEANPRRDPLLSTGGEVVADFLTFFSIPLTLRTGVAVRLDDVGGTGFYVRIGRAF